MRPWDVLRHSERRDGIEESATRAEKAVMSDNEHHRVAERMAEQVRSEAHTFVDAYNANKLTLIGGKQHRGYVTMLYADDLGTEYELTARARSDAPSESTEDGRDIGFFR